MFTNKVLFVIFVISIGSYLFTDAKKRKGKGKEESNSGFSKAAKKKCTKEEKALIKCSDKNTYDVNITDFNVDAKILKKFVSSKNHTRLIKEAIEVMNGNAIEQFLASIEFAMETKQVIEAYVKSEEGLAYIEEKVKQWYDPLALLHDKFQQTVLLKHKSDALKVGDTIKAKIQTYSGDNLGAFIEKMSRQPDLRNKDSTSNTPSRDWTNKVATQPSTDLPKYHQRAKMYY